MDFDKFVREIEENHWNVHGVEVYENDRLIHQYGNTRLSRFPIYSATKTITSIAFGMAWDEGKIHLEQSILTYLPEEVLREIPESQVATFEQITMERLLTMSVAGFPFRPEGESWLHYALSCPLSNVQERVFDYSNIPAYLVGVALTHAVGEDLYQYLDRKLFTPLQIIAPIYQRCPEGYFYGASGMELSVQELSRIGLLLYHKGLYEGQRIVSDDYVERATGIRQMNREGGYGYFIWKYLDGFSINGKWKQKCYILPERGLVITYLSHIEEETAALKENMERTILNITRQTI
ncbi:MAG: serine hydrolase [Lachnospiraceae bacterium]|nr:serine hydrolase [Lachnospiraceae bacterium]